MVTLKIDTAYSNQKMSHGNICKMLKDYTSDELLDLAILAKRSNSPALLRCFIGTLPKLNVLVSQKVSNEQLEIQDAQEEIKEKETDIDNIHSEINQEEHE